MSLLFASRSFLGSEVTFQGYSGLKVLRNGMVRYKTYDFARVAAALDRPNLAR